MFEDYYFELFLNKSFQSFEVPNTGNLLSSKQNLSQLNDNLDRKNDRNLEIIREEEELETNKKKLEEELEKKIRAELELELKTKIERELQEKEQLERELKKR